MTNHLAMLSARKGASRAHKHHKHYYKYLKYVFIIVIFSLTAASVWFLHLQTSVLSDKQNDELLSIQSLDGEQEERIREAMYYKKKELNGGAVAVNKKAAPPNDRAAESRRKHDKNKPLPKKKDNVIMKQEEQRQKVNPFKDNKAAVDDQQAAKNDEDALVQCGGHVAPSCDQCPQGNGALWCNGECTWCDFTNKCIHHKFDKCPVEESKLRQNKGRVSCGAHFESSCKACPQGHGEEWCNGDCAWCDETNECMDRYTGCAMCQAKGKQGPQQCNTVDGCFWCAMTNQCLQKSSTCPKEPVWRPPEPEPWFVPPDPIDKYGLTLSVVLPCGNEGEFFERTIRSIFATTPPEILHEIVVVDDNSSPPLESVFKLDAEEYKVKFLRSNVTLGLIDAKHQGAEIASGDIIVFFDCHVKPAIGYWEPFVREIADNPKRVVVPTITGVNVDTWRESARPTDKKGGSSKCYLTFDSDFKWTGDETPWVPIMSGGLLAIGREWFFEIGGHDQAMKGWGGENIDLSLRIWRCGGEIVAAVHSYVGHMWRVADKKNTKAKYTIPGNSAMLNRARAFMAHAPELFAKKTVTFPGFAKWRDTGGSDLDVESIQSKMKELQCKDFNWYLGFFKYIYRDGGLIPKEAFQLSPDGGKTCLRLKKRASWGFATNTGDDLSMDACVNVTGIEVKTGTTQYWALANRNKEGKCCQALQNWNTGQCMLPGLKTYCCNMNDQPAQLTPEGLLKVGEKCLSANPLRETPCTAASKWQKLRPFEPPEYTLLSQDLKDIW